MNKPTNQSNMLCEKGLNSLPYDKILGLWNSKDLADDKIEVI